MKPSLEAVAVSFAISVPVETVGHAMPFDRT